MSGGEETHCERGGALGSVRVARVCRAAGLLVADGPGPLASFRKSRRKRAVYRPVPELGDLRAGSRDWSRFSTRPMPIQRRTCDIGVDVQENAFWMCIAPIPQVAERLGVAPRPSERLCRSGPQGRGRERPPCFDAQCGHRGGLGCARHPTLPRGSLPVHQSLQEGQTASRSGAAPVLVGHAEQPHRPSGRSTGPPQPRSGAHIAFPQGIIGSGATPGRQGRGCENTLGAMPHQALGAGGRSRHGPSGSCATGGPACSAARRWRTIG